MSELVASLTVDPLPLVVSFWAASVACVVVCARRYFAVRAQRLHAERAPREPFVDIASADTDASQARTAVATQEIGALGAASDPSRAAWADDRPTEGVGHRDRQPGEMALAPREQPATYPPPVNVVAAIRTRVSQDPAANGLRDLVRALYLDQSTFTFHTLAELSSEDRALAKQLVDAWLDDPAAIDDWEMFYATLREAPPSRHAWQHA